MYTGTHDNDTTLGWYNSLDDTARERVNAHLSEDPPEMPWALIRTAFESNSVLAIIPMQDLLALGNDARMNMPGTVTGNWSWRFSWDQVSNELAGRILSLGQRAARLVSS